MSHIFNLSGSAYLAITVNGVEKFRVSTTGLVVSQTFSPENNNTIALGASSKLWSDIFGINFQFGNSSNSQSVIVKSPTGLAASYTITLPGAQATVANQVLTNDGLGNLSWTTPSGTGANTALSNLTATSINQNLTPDGDNTRNLGASGNKWNNTYLNIAWIDGGAFVGTTTGNGDGVFIGKNTSSPGGGAVNGHIRTLGDSTLTARHLGVFTLDNGGNNTVATGSLYLETGKKTAGAAATGTIYIRTGNSPGGDSGDINLATGTSSANRGTVHVAPELRFDGSTSGYIGIKAPAAPTSHTVTLPSAQGGSGTYLQNDGSGNLSWATISAAGGGTGDDLSALQYNISLTDTFSDIPGTAKSSIDTTADHTNATFVAGSGSTPAYYQISYDASLTVTGTGTAMTLSGAPSFTVAVGDILVVAGYARRITVVTTQTSITVESAFPVDPSASACTVSQGVYTLDLNNTAYDGVTPASQFTDTISSTIVAYNDAATGTLYNGTDPALVGYTASSDGTTFSEVNVREASLSLSTARVGLPTAGSNFYLRFFANKTSGTGTVNLVGYKTFFHAQTATESGGVLNQAYAMTDNSVTPVNCTVSVVSGKTRLAFNFSYPVGVNPSTTNGALIVTVNGQKLPRFLSGQTNDAYYKEINATTIELDSDYSAFGYGIEAYQHIAVVDSSTQNTTNIAAILASKFRNYSINGNFDFWQRVEGNTTTVNTATTSTGYTADMFAYYSTGATVKNYSIARSTDVPTQAQSGYKSTYSYLFTMITGIVAPAAGDLTEAFQYRMEGYDFQRIHAKQVTISFWFKASITGTYSVALRNQATNRSYVTTFQVSSANTWEFKAITVQLDSVGTWTFDNTVALYIDIGTIAGTTFQTSTLDTWQSANVMMASSSSNWQGTNGATIRVSQFAIVEGSGFGATDFVRAGFDIQQELAMCQRYYCKTSPTGTAMPNSSHTFGMLSQTSNAGNALTSSLFFPTEMRIVPIVTVWDSANNQNKVTWADSGGSRTTNTTPPSTTTITTKGWYYSAGGIGSTSIGCMFLQFTAEAGL